MARARDLARQGKREGGRWKRGSVAIGQSPNSDTWRDYMKKAGYVIDVARRAAAMEPAPGVAEQGSRHGCRKVAHRPVR